MIKAEDIKDRDSLGQWLTEWPVSQQMSIEAAQHVAVLLMHRTTMRVLPIALLREFQDEKDRHQNANITDLRLHLLNFLKTRNPNTERGSMFLESFVNAAQMPASYIYLAAHLSHLKSVTECASDCILSAHLRLKHYVTDRTFLGTSVLKYERTPRHLWSAFASDAELIEQKCDLVFLPIWTESEPDWYRHAIFSLYESFEEQNSDWAFWRYFLERSRLGQPIAEKLAFDVLEINDENWKKDSSHIAKFIEPIWERHKLLNEVRTLRTELREVNEIRASAFHRNHNQPPELVKDALSQDAVTLIWDVLEEAEEELEKVKPDPSTLNALSLKLWAALKVIAAYCGKKADKAIGAAAVAVGSTSGVALVDAIANNGRLWEFAKHFLNYSGAG